MIAATRRTVLAGALAVPTIGGLAQWRWRHGEDAILIHDPALDAGRRFALAGTARGGEVLAIEGDRIRFARRVADRRPALIAGVSRHADALMIEDAVRESGYAPVAMLHGRANACSAQDCRPGWSALGRMAETAGGRWVEALAEFATRPGGIGSGAISAGAGSVADRGLVIGWLLAPQS